MALSVVPLPSQLRYPLFLNLSAYFIFFFLEFDYFLSLGLLSVILSLSLTPPLLHVSPLSAPAAPHLPSQSLTPTQCSPLLLNYLWPVMWIMFYSWFSIFFTSSLHLLRSLFCLLRLFVSYSICLCSLPSWIYVVSVVSGKLGYAYLSPPTCPSPLTLLFCWLI